MKALFSPHVRTFVAKFPVAYRRFIAVFFLSGFIAGIMAPTATAYAQNRPDPGNPHIKKEDPAVRNKAMKQDYPSGMQSIAADEKAAADAKPIVNGASDEISKKNTPAGEVLRGANNNPKITPHELVEKRTATSTVSVNADGTLTEKQFFGPKHYKKDGKWEAIDTGIEEDKNAGDSGNAFGRALGAAQSWFSGTTTFKTKANDWQARFASSDAKQGMVRIGKGSDQVSFVPVDAKQGVAPVVGKNSDGRQVVHYYDLWPGVNVEYVIETDAVKENIVLKDKNAANQISFKLVGANFEEKVEKHKVGNQEFTTKSHVLKGAMNDEFAIAPANLILNNHGFVTDKSVFGQEFQGDTTTVSVKKEYLQSLPDSAFPAVIDPSTFYGTFGTRAGGNYVSFKSDGYICYSHECNPYAGSVYDSNNILRYWRSAVHAPHSQLNDPNKSLQNATLHLKQRSNESFWTGGFDAHTYYAGHATCLNHFSNCLNGGVWGASGVVGATGTIDVTNIYQSRMSLGDYGTWLMLGGEDGTNHSFKNFDPGTGAYDSGSYVSFTYNGAPSAPTIQTPVADQVFVDPQPSFSVNQMSNPNGSTPLRYQMRVSNGPGGAGFLMASPVLASTQWTMPDSMLQDGSTYYLQARSFDPISGLYSDWGASVSFRIDTRTGIDSTQTYSTLGPVNVNLATGNLTTSASSHSSVAQGGALGIGLNYNTPLKSRNGLVGEYWNVAANYNGSAPLTEPNVTRVDRNVSFDWNTGSPSSGAINDDWFYTRWTGYFVAPVTGTYQFGGKHDDKLEIHVNNQQLYTHGGCYTGVCYGTTVTLQAGQVVPIRMEYTEATSPAYAQVYVKGAVDEQIIPTEWLQTGVRPVSNKNYGLAASYFARLDGTNTFSANNHKVMQRVDRSLNFNWGAGAPVPKGPEDFLVRWTGFIKAPQTGVYTLGSRSDDGTKITVGSTVALNDWTNHGAPATPTWGGTTVTLNAGVAVPITIEYYDGGGGAAFELWIKGGAASANGQLMPLEWLSTDSQVLPDGWDIGVDGSGTARYNHLTPNQNNAVLTDSSGGTHEYAWKGSGFAPPANENGHLVRNEDGTFTLHDGDGQTYVFAADGTLTSVTSASDDRAPAALSYEYNLLNGSPTQIYKIKDGVDPSRNLTLYYSGQSQCGNAPVGFDANAPAGMLCAAQTDDGRTTYFYYVEKQLSRIAMPGNSFVDYQYEKLTNSNNVTVGYRLAGVRDSLANDAIAAGVRANDDNVKTQIGYDVLGRAINVTQPAPTTGANRMQHTIEYLPGSKAHVDENGSSIPGYAGMTKQHVVGANEPNGFTRRIKYDNLYRTVEATDIAGLSSVVEWNEHKDLVYSSTDATGLRSTTTYNDEDRPISGYGPAPKAWFTTGTPNNQVPQTAYAGQVPRTDVTYDEGITGPAVRWFDYTKRSGAATGALSGAPKHHATGINSTSPGTLSNPFTSPPITAGQNSQGIGFSASGKLRLPNGTYTISADTSDGIRVWVDDGLVLDQWVDGAHRNVSGTAFTVSNSAPKRIMFEAYRRTGSTGTLNIKIAQSGGFAATTDWSAYIKPGYGLTTSAKTYDSTVGDSTSAVNYGNTPELGLPQTISTDPSGLNLSAKAAYEQPNAQGSYLRPTAKSRPGDAVNNPATSYVYYGATDTEDNPCTTVVDNFKQAGLVKRVIDASPDGGTTPGRVTETRYDGAGRIVAVRTNNEAWLCTTYDARGRVTQTTFPAVGSEAARTVTNNHAVYGDPTFTSTEDSTGVNLQQIDLLGRPIYYHDAQWNETWTGYDSLGRTLWRGSDVGNESFVYDAYGRLTQHKLDNATYAVVSYDQYGRTQSIEYPNAGGQKMVVSRDALGRVTGQKYYAGGSQAPAGNLLANPSYEQASSNPDVPEGWYRSNWGTNTPDYTYLNEGYTGNRSVKTELTSYTDGDAKWQHNQVAVTPSTTYSYKDFYKSNVTTEMVIEYKHQNQSYSYEWLGFVNASADWKQNSVNFTTPATATHATVLHFIKTVGWLTVDDAELTATSSGGQTVIASDEVVRSQTGRIVSGTENGQTKSYTYDKAGRLTNAAIGTNTYSYGYGAQSGACAAGTNVNTGKNSNRTSQTINGVTTNYCYDYADRLKSSSDALANNAQYDAHGNLTQIGSGGSPLRLGYDSSDRNMSLEQYDGSGNGTASYYSRDAQGRITYRETDAIANWNWTLTDEKWYGFTGNGDAPSVVRNAAWDVVEKYLSLPGGVLLTVRPPQTGNANKTYSLPNLHGSIMATTDASGALTGTYRYDPYGNKTSSSLPNNSTSGTTLGWAGRHGRSTETSFALTPIQMGARVYLPTLGRFAQVDPLPGGNVNDYVYAVDPVNTNDFSGRFLQGGAGAGYLQNAAGTNRLQPAAPAPYYQPAAGVRAVQNARNGNLPIIGKPTPAPAPKRNDSTALPVAKVDAQWFANAAQAEQKRLFTTSGPEEGYSKIQFDINYFVGIGGGIIYDKSNGNWHFFAGPVLQAVPFGGVSVTDSTTSMSCGWGTSASYFAGFGQVVGPGTNEVGIGTLGAGMDAMYVFC